MSFVLGSFVAGVAMALVRASVARTLLLIWFALLAVVVGPVLLMPQDSSGLLGDSAALTVVALPLSLLAGWIAGRGSVRMLRRTA